jgi:pyrrolysine biosynthesis protein PylD
MEKYDKELTQKTGCTLLEIAEDAVQTSVNVRTTLRKSLASVVPITSGGGMIEGFSEAIVAILNHIGVRARTTQEVDIGGIAEAYEKRDDLMFVADDRVFVAINLLTNRVVDNAAATAKAYVAALNRMANGLKGKSVLVIGIGHVGTAAVTNLIMRKAKPSAVDIDRFKLQTLNERFGRKVLVFRTLAEAMERTDLVINTAPGRNIIKANMIREHTLISAPAIPLGLTRAALRKVGQHIVHDSLELGVATMAVEACVN